MHERYFYGSMDPFRGMPHWYSPFLMSAWSNLEKALHSTRQAFRCRARDSECEQGMRSLGMQGGESLMWVRIPPWTLCAYSRTGIGAALRMQFRRRSKGSTPFMRTTYWAGEMVDTGASNTPAEMHEGSNPSSSRPS